MQAGELRNRIEIYKNGEGINELGEDTDEEVLWKVVFAKIVPTTGTTKNLAGNSTETEINHKMTVRSGLALTKEMFIRYRGQRHDIKYWQPIYKNTSFLEIFTTMEVRQ